MQKSLFLSAILSILIFTSAKSQCLPTGFTIPDSVCSGQPFQIVNTSSTGMSYQWDLCSSDLSKIPYGQNIGNVGGLSFPQQVKAITDNGKYYVFIANNFGNGILRYNYGTSLNNIPVAYDYGSFGGVISNPNAIDIIKDNGIWYAILANSSASNKKLIRVNLGALIESNIASATDLGPFNLNTPKNLKIAKDGANYHVFATNEVGNDLTRIDFGNSIANTPSGFTALTNTNFEAGWGIDIAYDCSLSKFIGFFVANVQNKIQVLDFGNSLVNVPVIAQTITTTGGPTGLQLVKDGINWHLIFSAYSVNQVHNYKIGDNLLNVPTLIFADTVAGVKAARSIGILKDSSGIYGFTTNTGPASFSQFRWPENCTLNPKYSTDPSGVTVTATGSGYQSITLSAYDSSTGKINSFTDSIFVSPSPSPYFVTGLACGNLPVQFTDSSTIASGSIASWSYDFGDSSPVSNNANPIHSYNSTGTYTVTLSTVSDAGCSNNYSTAVTVGELPVANFSFVNNSCSGTPVVFNDLSQVLGASIASWTWDFGDSTAFDSLQNPVHTFLNAGTYSVNLSVIANTGCSDTLSQLITIIPSPVANFVTSSTCLGETASFTNTTTIQGGGSISYTWDFGDSGNSILTNPVHQYAAIAGNYDVTLIATALNGCSDTIVENIRISNKPVPQFSWNPTIVCQGNQVSFTSTSTGTGGDTISIYLWEFGDSSNSSLENPFHVYADTGYYDVTLTVVSPTNCDSSITQQVYVIPSPTASFTAPGVCLNLSTSFNPLVNTPPGTQVDSIVWTFGDGTGFSGITSPVHTYSTPGRYEVIMTVYNNLLCTGTFVDSVDVYPLPTADFTTTLSCSGSVTGFDGSISSVTGDTLATWLWDFDGLGSSTDTIAQFNFPNAGIYSITLIASTIHGCRDTIQKPVEVIQSPDFDFIFNEPCFGFASTFTYSSNILPAPPADLIWDFGDGSLSYLLSPSHIYTAVDTFDVILSVENPNTLCSSTKLKQLIVKPLPNAGYIVLDNCEDLPLQFTDTSSLASGFIASWNWNLGSLGNSTDPNPVVTPQTPGIYATSLTVISDQGCTSSATKTVTVFAKPVAEFIPDPIFGSPPLTVNFNNTTTGASSYIWNFGDGSSATGLAPTHIYPDTGLFNITLIASSIEGCLDTAAAIVSVIDPILDIGINKIYATQDGTSIRLTAEFINAGNVTINEFSVKGIIENGSIINEKWEGSFAPGTLLLYTFKSSYEVSSSSLPTFYCIEALNPNDSEDINPANNKKCEVLNTEFELFSVYPNPFDDQLTVSFNLNTDGYYNIEIYDDAGKLVIEKENQSGLKGFNAASVSTTALSKGSYSCAIRFRNDIRTLKVVKIK